MRTYYVYIVASRSRCIYTGVTNDLVRRVYRHKFEPSGFAARYRTNRLVFYEQYERATTAIEREKEIKLLMRWKKLRLIEQMNPTWDDLANSWFEES